jgi:hypothetical protein
MSRVVWGLGLSFSCLMVAASVSVPEVEADVTPAGRVIRVAQKQKTAKKKARTTPAEEPATPPATLAGGILKFSKDIAPILVSNCADCHIRQAKKRGDFDMTTFEKLMKGTSKEKVIEPGNPDESHLVLRIKGEETPKMPQGGNRNLSQEAIAKIEQWVRAGAALDTGVDPKAPIESYASSPEDLRKAALAKMSPAQRDKQVETVGRDRWKKASPKTTPELTSGTHFMLFSTLPKARASAALKKVEDQYETVRSLAGPTSVDWGEKASLFVFNDSASYGEFVQSNEKREVETGEPGTSQFAVPQPYVAVIDPLGGRDAPEPLASSAPKKASRSKKGRPGGTDEASLGGAERTLAGLLTEQFAIGATARTGKPPRWVTLGLGALISSRVEPGSPYYRKIRRDALEVCNLGWVSKANDALGDQERTGVVRAVGFAILDALSKNNASALPPLIAEMAAGGNKLDEAIGAVLDMNRAQFLNASGEYVMTNYGR